MPGIEAGRNQRKRPPLPGKPGDTAAAEMRRRWVYELDRSLMKVVLGAPTPVKLS